MKLEFDHVGLVTDKKRGEENWVESTRVWVTNPKTHPFKIEWLRFEPDSPVRGPVRENPHVAYRVENLEKAAEGLKVLIEPFEVGGFLKVGFYEYSDGSVIELMQYLKDEGEWFPEE